MSFIRQPFLHFLLIGAGLFALYALIGNEPETRLESAAVVVSEQDARWLARQFEATWRRQPAPEELERLIDEFVREEIYVREALALGLDQGDAVVRQRLRQKMEFISEASAAAAAPDEAELRAFFQENADRFEIAPSIAFSQIMIGDGSAEQILADLTAGAAPETLGDRTLLPSQFPPSPMQVVDGTFGSGFFDQLNGLEIGVWAGPVTSRHGDHVVRVDGREGRALPDFEDVRAQVELQWRAAEAARIREERFDALASRYAIERPDPALVLDQ